MATQPARTLAEGPRGKVVGLELPSGQSPAEDFLRALATREQARYLALLERLTQAGFLRAPNDMRRLEVAGDPHVYEIKVHTGPGYRLYVVQEHRRWVATHGGKKPKDKAVPAEVAKARMMYREWQA